MKNIEKALTLKQELDSLRPISGEDEQRIMQKFRLDWNYHSNNLEGNTLTYGETKALILFGITAQGKPLKDHFEITGHDEAIKWILEIVDQDRPLTENFIRELHKLILKEPYEVDAITPDGQPTKKKISVGTYKTSPNHVKTRIGEIFRFATPEETPAKMNDLVNWYREKTAEKAVNPILLAAEFHYKFIRIHPFDDGNGRTARILMNFILMQFGYPPVIIKTEDKANYFSVLRQADAGILEPFVEYIAENLNRSLDIMIKGAKGESIEEPDDLDKEIALLEKEINSLSEPIEISKSKESITKVYEDSIARLASRFVEKCELFDKFYVKKGFRVYIDNLGTFNRKESAIPSGSNKLNDETGRVKLLYEYQSFNQTGFQELNHTSGITIRFNLNKYHLRSHSGLEYEKSYSQQLSDNEISELVKSEIRRHKRIIDQKIDEMKKK